MPRECLTNLGEETESADLRASERVVISYHFFRKQLRGVAHTSNNLICLCLRIRKTIVAWEDKDQVSKEFRDIRGS